MKAEFVVISGTENFPTWGNVELVASREGNDEWFFDDHSGTVRGSIVMSVDRTKAGTDDLFKIGNVVAVTLEVVPSPSTTSVAPSADESTSTSPESPAPADVVASSDVSGPPSDSTLPGESTGTSDSVVSSTPDVSSSTS